MSSGLALAAAAYKVSFSVGTPLLLFRAQEWPENGGDCATIVGEEDLQNLWIFQISVLVSALSQFSKLSKYTQGNVQATEYYFFVP